MLTVGDRFPDFELTGVESSDPATAFRKVRHDDFTGRRLTSCAWVPGQATLS